MTMLRRSLGQRGDVADKIIERLGLIGLQKKIKRAEKKGIKLRPPNF